MIGWKTLVKSDSCRRSTIIWWKWSKGFDNRIKLIEKDQYYKSWYDRSYRNMYRDFKDISCLQSTISSYEIDHLITSEDLEVWWDLHDKFIQINLKYIYLSLIIRIDLIWSLQTMSRSSQKRSRSLIIRFLRMIISIFQWRS